MRDDLIADCVAEPSNDGPRLVWADAVGGERGELVVIQCDLARGGLAPAEARARRMRERELLARHAVTWAGEVATLADRWSFRRGFVEAVVLPYMDVDVPRLRAAAPLLGSLSLLHVHEGVIDETRLAQLRGIRGLSLGNDYLGDAFSAFAPALANLQLQALALDGLDPRCLPAVLELCSASPIETLRLRTLRLSPALFERVLARVPRLRSLDLDAVEHRKELISIAAQHPLRALRLGMVRAEEISALGAMASLERLGFSMLGDQFELPSFPSLSTIEIDGNLEATVRALIAIERPALRVIRIQTKPVPALLQTLESRFGSQLEMLDVSDDGLVFARPYPELLHHDPDAMISLGTPWHRVAPPFVLVRLDRDDKLHELPAMPVDQHVVLGRGGTNEVVVHAPTVARRHARLTWRDDHHEIYDHGSVNGTFVNGDRVERSPLRDGDEFALSPTVRFRYFVGPGARERARAQSLVPRQ